MMLYGRQGVCMAWLRYALFGAALLFVSWGFFTTSPPFKDLITSNFWKHSLSIFVFVLASILAFRAHASSLLFWVVAAVSAILFEVLQHPIAPSREFSWDDLLANLAGVSMALIMYLMVLYLSFLLKPKP